MTRAVSNTDSNRIEFIATLKETILNLHLPPSFQTSFAASHADKGNLIFVNEQPLLSLAKVREGIHDMTVVEDGETADAADPCCPTKRHEVTTSTSEPTFLVGNFTSEETLLSKPVILTKDQQEVVHLMLDNPNDQKLFFLHSGGGTGKSTIVQKINNEFEARDQTVANTCCSR